MEMQVRGKDRIENGREEQEERRGEEKKKENVPLLISHCYHSRASQNQLAWQHSCVLMGPEVRSQQTSASYATSEDSMEEFTILPSPASKVYSEYTALDSILCL